MDFQGARFWVFYDGECRLCTGWARRLKRILGRPDVGFAPLQEAGVRERLGMAADEPLVEMKVLTRGGKVLGGAAAVLEICRCVWWLVPVFVVGQLPPVGWMLERGYRWLAVRRHCVAGRCRLDGREGGKAP